MQEEAVSAKQGTLNPPLARSTVCFLDRSASCVGAVPDAEVFLATFALAVYAGLLPLKRSVCGLELSWEDKERGRGISMVLSFAVGRGAAGVAGGLKSSFLCWLPPY